MGQIKTSRCFCLMPILVQCILARRATESPQCETCFTTCSSSWYMHHIAPSEHNCAFGLSSNIVQSWRDPFKPTKFLPCFNNRYSRSPSCPAQWFIDPDYYKFKGCQCSVVSHLPLESSSWFTLTVISYPGSIIVCYFVFTLYVAYSLLALIWGQSYQWVQFSNLALDLLSGLRYIYFFPDSILNYI